LAQFGTLTVTLSFDLHPTRRMAQQDPAVVLKNLDAHGFHVQLPPAQYQFGNAHE
jgi:uncharacterized protein